ncbi:MAG: M4 family metallopeptidase, partial [Bacteroidales bacterium]|nr:M4 family metallopeptidase [Bacteroidales bacterium]
MNCFTKQIQQKHSKNLPIIYLLAVISLFVNGAFAQTSLKYSPDGLGVVVYAEFDVNSPKQVSERELFYSVLGLSSDNNLTPFDSVAINDHLFSYSYMQHYKGIEVEGSSMRLHYKNGRLFRFTGHYLPLTDFDTTCSITPAAAADVYRRHYALPDSPALTFLTERVFVHNPDKANTSLAMLPMLCYKLIPRETAANSSWLYIDVKTGNVIREEAVARAAQPAELHTYYYGIQYANTGQAFQYGSVCSNFNDYVLMKTSPFGNIYTCSFVLRPSQYFPPFPIIAQQPVSYGCAFHRDADNIWTRQEHPNFYILDTHWGMSKIHDYFQAVNWGWHTGLTVFMDYDNPAYIDNAHCIAHPYQSPAGWYYPALVIGKPALYKPFTTVDILAHEFSHVLDIMYRKSFFPYFEPEVFTAFTEGLGDVWGAIMEHYAGLGSPNDPWKIGERVVDNHGYSCLRNLADPEDANAKIPMASLYLSPQYQAGDEYAKSGVFSHWFYLLVEGGECDSVTGIGWEKAEQLIRIAQRAYFIYDTVNSSSYNFNQVRAHFMAVARDNCGSWLTPADTLQIARAWDAVGVYGFDYVPLDNNDIIVHGNEVWNEPRQVKRPVDIYGTLTVNADVYCEPDVAFTVHPGGKLIIDGATLSNSRCAINKMWQGITVLGHSNVSQFDFTANGQGSLYIRNGATIEHAVCAIRNYAISNGSADFTTTGGNISASNSRFIDNAKMVSLAPYTHSDSRATTFSNCTFEITPT